MIVLDEQLLGRQIETEVRKWYRGKVCFITDLRAGRVPELLRKLFRAPELRTTALRSGKVLRVSRTGFSLYTHEGARVRTVRW